MMSEKWVRTHLVCLVLVLYGLSTAFAADAEMLKNYPTFALGDQKPLRTASCGELRAIAEHMPAFDFRIDLAVAGPLAAVQTDGALWYLVMCEAPDAQVMCVTYQDNGMKPGDIVTFGDGYAYLDDDQIMLDPCLAGTVG